MRKFSFQTFFLTLSIVVSLLLSYILIFDNNALLSRFSSNQETAQVNIQIDSNNKVSDYYQLANVKLAEIIYPTNVIISEGDKAYLLNDYSGLRSLASSLSQKRISLVEKIVVPSEEKYIELISQERVEFEFSTALPFELVDNFIKNESEETEFEFNRIIFPKNEKNTAYLLNTFEQVYMKAKLSEGNTTDDYFKIARVSKGKWVVAERYNLSNGNHVYLPLKTMTVPSQLYTLNLVPETNVIDSLFGNVRSWRSVSTNEDSSSGTIMYYNSNMELQINPFAQMLGINYKNTNQFEAKTYRQRIEQSYSQMRQFEYWKNGIRIGTQSNGTTIVYQRYLDGYPTFSSSMVNHYASSRVYFRGGNLTTSITRLALPMVYLEAHVADQSREYELMSVDELIYELNMAGYSVSDFTNVVIGYEWQNNMSEFQKVNFVPKWFFEINNVYYSIDQIREGELEAMGNISDSRRYFTRR
ncbi:hypothetical protein HMPREF2811_00815 [Globicatella sp. HMSC072A10]|uniref:hypothetical protein n=1 Tax=Globicatella sp. HMSC072A10 TaxID=1739315 RepID=UPI0008D47D73|nr:hypothetical protein [Globicatella sp. HMSC072A10]OFK59563.1 hypothetical protein HMPREF2811_00815 [Globicatella sp. HMSC072A10]